MTRFFPSVDRNLCVTATKKQSRQYRSFVRSVKTASEIRHFLQIVEFEVSDFSVEHSDKVSASESSNRRSPCARLHIFWLKQKTSENSNFWRKKNYFSLKLISFIYFQNTESYSQHSHFNIIDIFKLVFEVWTQLCGYYWLFR